MSQLNHKTNKMHKYFSLWGVGGYFFHFFKTFTEDSRAMYKSELKVYKMYEGTKSCRLGKRRWEGDTGGCKSGKYVSDFLQVFFP